MVRMPLIPAVRAGRGGPESAGRWLRAIVFSGYRGGSVRSPGERSISTAIDVHGADGCRSPARSPDRRRGEAGLQVAERLVDQRGGVGAGRAGGPDLQRGADRGDRGGGGELHVQVVG